MKQEYLLEHTEKVKLGQMANDLLNSDYWTVLLKPMLDSMLLGLRDVTTVDVSSDKKAAIEVKARTQAAKYIEEIETLIRAYIDGGEMSRKVLESASEQKPALDLFKEV